MTDVETVALREELALHFFNRMRARVGKPMAAVFNAGAAIYLPEADAILPIIARERAAALSAATPVIEARVQRETIEALNQPGSMQVHMLRGIINPMPLLDCLHLHGITAKDNWVALTIDEAIELADAAAIRKG